MKVEILTIGDEVLQGQVVNTNAAFLGERLTDAGIQVGWMTVVGDDRQQMLHAFRRADSRARAVILTGGLGPTPDDMTKPCLVEFFGDKLVFRDDLLEKVKKRFTDRGLEFPDTSRNQAEFPSGARLIPNPNGTAAGIHYVRKKPVSDGSLTGSEWFALPGIPLEMQAMVDDYVLPRLKEIGLGGHVAVRLLRTTGIPESLLMKKLTRLIDAASLVEIAFLPRFYGVDLKLTGRAGGLEEINRRLDQAEQLLLPDLEPYLYARGTESLPQVVGRLAREEGLRIAVAESCTGGLIAKQITDVPGSSDYFERGLVTYSNRSKTELLGISESIIEKRGAVSEPVARAMAERLLERSGANITAATTGIAGPTGGTPEKPVGLVFIAVADRSGCEVKEVRLSGQREAIRERGAAAALKLLHDHIKRLDSGQ